MAWFFLKVILTFLLSTNSLFQNSECDYGKRSMTFIIDSVRNKSAINIHVSKNMSCELTNFPTICKCKEKTALHCMNVAFTQIPNDIHGNITALNLKNNTVTTISKDAFKNYSYLKMIHLEANHIDMIEPFAFQNLNSLEKLFLARNRLKGLITDSFIGLYQVKWIGFQYNLLEDMDLRLFSNTPKLTTLDLHDNYLTLENTSFPHLPYLTWLELHNNKISKLTEELFYNLTSLGVLSLQDNKIKFIHKKAFYRQVALTELNLANNLIEFLHDDVFVSQRNLSKLTLGGNPISTMSTGLFKNLYHLESLDLKEMIFTNISISQFIPMKNLKFIYFKKFHYCRFVPHVRVCKPNTDGVSSVEHLLVNPILRSSVWVVAILTCLGNAIVLLGRLISPEENKVLSIFIRNLSAADFLMGIYLLVIGTVDSAFRNQYNWYANVWMSSWKCTFSGALAMTSSETSVLIMCFMSVERFFCIVSPFGGNRLTTKKAISSMACIWILGILLSVVPIFHWGHSNEFYGSNGMCFPLHIDDPFILGWEYSAFLFLGINFLSVLIIIIVYIIMFISIHRTRKATTLMVSDKEFAFRFFFIVFTDCLCWIPIIILKFIAVGNFPVTADLYAWVVVFILPINSAINPFLYTFTTSKFRSQAKKVISAFAIVVTTTLARKESSSVLADAPVSLDHHYSFKDTELKNGPQIQNKVPHPIPAYTCNLNPYVVEQLTIEDVISNSPYKDPHSVSVISESAL